MKQFLIVVDMQKDFVDGALGTPEAVKIVPRVASKIQAFQGDVFVTYDTHFENYMDSAEGKALPVPHCIKGTAGWQLDTQVAEALKTKNYASADGEDFSLELVGLCTDICVVSNALLLKATFPEVPIRVDSSCCAGVTPATHDAALTTMKMCQIEVI